MIGGDVGVIYWLLTDVTHLHLIRWRLLGGPLRLRDDATGVIVVVVFFSSHTNCLMD